MTNYVTAQPPEWAENTALVWSAFGSLAVVSLGLFFWERRLAAGPQDDGVRPVPLGRIAAGGHSMNPPTVSARVRGREAELERIGTLVRGPGGGMVVVCGAGGLGKTTLAAEASARARAEGRVVVWTRWRDDPAQLGQDLAQAAHILGLPEDRLEEARTGRVSLVDAVWEHLATVKGWLIVVDNVDAPSRVGPGAGPCGRLPGLASPARRRSPARHEPRHHPADLGPGRRPDPPPAPRRRRGRHGPPGRRTARRHRNRGRSAGFPARRAPARAEHRGHLPVGPHQPAPDLRRLPARSRSRVRRPPGRRTPRSSG